jgi:protein-L-isoaspartate(D-aspartate) O-methyltransferase
MIALPVTAVMHRLVGDKGLVVGIDHLQPLTSMSERNLRADGIDIAIEDGKRGVKIVLADGRQGYSSSGAWVSSFTPSLPEAC